MVEPGTFHILEVNQKAVESFHFSRSEFQELTLFDVIQPWDMDRFHIALREKEFDSAEFRAVTLLAKNGEAMPVDLLIRETIFGEQAALLVVLANAALRIQLEDQLRQSKKMESIGMLAGGVAHDFNNLLTIISGYSHMLMSSLANDPKNRVAAEQVIKASERAAELTSQLLAFSRRQTVQAKIVNLNSVVQGMTPMLKRLIGEHIDLRFLLSDELVKLYADSSQVEQVIMNLVVNARDAMPEGGKLLVETHNVDLDGSFATGNMKVRPGQYAMLSVTDSGIGMDGKTRERIFEPFFTTKETGHGTGLGLSMVLGILKRYKGTVEICSELGQGTTIKVYFPKADQGECVVVPEAKPEPKGGYETVLLVEDDKGVATMVRTALEWKGYRVLEANTAPTALKLTQEHASEIQLLITDLVMPDMSGPDVAKSLHRKRPGLPVLYISGYSDATHHEDLHKGKKGFHFLGKPFTPAVLVGKVRDVLDQKSMKRQVKKEPSVSTTR